MAYNDRTNPFKGFPLYLVTVVKMKKAIQVRNEGSAYGFGSIEPSKAPYLLREINFNQQIPFRGVIRKEYSVTSSQDKKTARFSMPGFILRTRINWTTPYRQVRFYTVIAQVSDKYSLKKSVHLIRFGQRVYIIHSFRPQPDVTGVALSIWAHIIYDPITFEVQEQKNSSWQM